MAGGCPSGQPSLARRRVIGDDPAAVHKTTHHFWDL